ncbi:MAG TPA: acetylglutamate kinase [Flavihumibacter sp.]|nr:acetylglutamate kinase [Flavihumibacter sp.]HQD09843.1 acetylglutamate kinase [Flavihumibacter sp.]
MKKLFVIKIGGNVIDNEAALDVFLQKFARIDAPKLLVHGGGKIATRLGDKLGIESKYVDGRRITDDATIDLVTMVYGGLINKKIVAVLQSLGCNALGITGADGNLVPAEKRPVKTIDYGWVGDVKAGEMNGQTWSQLLEAGFVPVLAPLTHDGAGHILNTNADTMASSVAVCLGQQYDVRLIYCFEKKGILADIEKEDSAITHLNIENYTSLKAAGKLFAGILPKIDNAFAAIDAGVQEVLIGHADDLLQNTGATTTGTLITH